MTYKSQTRLEIEDEISKVAMAAYRASDGSMQAATDAVKAAFPGIPNGLAIEAGVDAWMKSDEADAEHFFEKLERTIDGEVIRAAARTAADEAVDRDRRIAMATNMARGLRLVPKTKRTGKGAPR